MTGKEEEKQRIADLLEEKNLTVEWLNIFDRVSLKVKDHDGKVVWSHRAIDKEFLRRELLRFLYEY